MTSPTLSNELVVNEALLYTAPASLYVYDIGWVLPAIYDSFLPKWKEHHSQGYLEFLIDGFIKHTIHSFQLGTVGKYHCSNYTAEEVEWMNSPECNSIVSWFWHNLWLRPHAVGKTICIERQKHLLYVTVPID